MPGRILTIQRQARELGRLLEGIDKAWGLEPNSRLSCQAIVAEEDLVVEIPKYTINHAAEKSH